MTTAQVPANGQPVFITFEGRLQAISAALKGGGKVPTATVREFLGWYGVARRGYKVVDRLRYQLRKADLETQPDFASAYIDAEIEFALVAPKKTKGDRETKSVTIDSVLVVQEDKAPISIGISDPTYRIGRLPAANTTLVRVAPDNPVEKALTLMLAHDFSQLPVMTGDFSVKGVITWQSLAAGWAFSKDGTTVRDFMVEAPEVPADRSLFAAIPLIAQHGFVLVRDASSRYTGIVTTTDVSVQFQQLSEPFLLLGEIENHVRLLMDGKFTKAELEQAKDPSDTSRKVESVADLTYGEYIRLLEKPELWAKLGMPIERTIFIDDLKQVKDIRNDVMHFDPDPIDGPELDTLRRFAVFLQKLQKLGA